ncbi:proline iminopeptidase-family hydrolase [Deinococcus peraridilitoris]|uniref:Proline-specific peptidase n=1 Tax=Deinococcus peraridilitoris (strain DSM 19664 / LMG 22246 / CIP 109416 / KR-200) TaxID=937777 RepID=L0A648_DEIPD|nr:proline iminopeptidase-family hydrolase [Deinococcus peraridilitoris]AFZ69363.1 proline-specific peptidase [Deinococcus peraridilitoris DSM 19664]
MTRHNDPVKRVQVDGQYHVWTKKVGHGPVTLLLLHGGPGCTHEYFECFEQWLSPDKYTFYYYDQLGSFYSDQPDDPSLWTVERFREEVEQVRQALGLEQFYLFGNSWGGMLALEYALKYQTHLKGLIVSNMTASIASYVAYINELREQLPEEDVARMKQHETSGELDHPEYQELLMTLYNRHICRVVPWPEPVQRMFSHLATPVYNTMQGPNEFVVSGNFKDWNRWEDLHRITVPTLLSVGRHDSMNPADIQEMGRRMQNATVSICENGSHLSMWDDANTYFGALEQFIHEVEQQGVARP